LDPINGLVGSTDFLSAFAVNKWFKDRAAPRPHERPALPEPELPPLTQEEKDRVFAITQRIKMTLAAKEDDKLLEPRPALSREELLRHLGHEDLDKARLEALANLEAERSKG
jgi:hypothetical protein